MSGDEYVGMGDVLMEQAFRIQAAEQALAVAFPDSVRGYVVSVFRQGGLTSTGASLTPHPQAGYVLRLLGEVRPGDETPLLDRCWGWTGSHNATGRPILRLGSIQEYAYRTLWSGLFGELDPFFDLHHVCSAPHGDCLNPAHLCKLTPSEHRAVTLYEAGAESDVSRELILSEPRLQKLVGGGWW